MNQCQAMLKQLYAEQPLTGKSVEAAAAEFAAYRLLYALAHSTQQLAEELRALGVSRHGWLHHPYVRHALQVRPAVPPVSCRRVPGFWGSDATLHSTPYIRHPVPYTLSQGTRVLGSRCNEYDIHSQK